MIRGSSHEAIAPNRLWRLALSALLALGCGTRAPTPASPVLVRSSADPTPPPSASDEPARPTHGFVFDWSPPCRVPVEESVTRKGKNARLAYHVALRTGQHGSLTVSLEDLEFVEFDGRPISPALREQLQPALELASALPSFEISRVGRYLRCEGLDDMVRRLNRQLKIPPERAEQLQRLMASPRMSAAMQASIGSYWATWVETWIGWDLAPESAVSSEIVQPLPGGGQVPATVRREFLGLRNGYALLRQTTTLSGETATRAITDLLDDLAEGAGADEDNHGVVLKDGRIQVILFAETLPSNLRPRHTRFERRQELEFSNGAKRADVEVRDLEWRWERAAGCSPTTP